MNICNGGFLEATGHSLPVEHFYKFHKFKREVAKANRVLGEAQADLFKECKIDPCKFNEAPKEDQKRFKEANKALLEEDAGIEVKARIPIEFYKALYDENKTERLDIFASPDVEAVILDNLFTEIKEE